MELTVYKAENIGDEQRDSFVPIGRLDSKLTGKILGFTGDKDIQMLMAAGLLKPLGNPKQDCTKYFSWEDIKNKARDVGWLAKATDAIYKGWQTKNAPRRAKKIEELPKAA